jgi:hypothetical protein
MEQWSRSWLTQWTHRAICYSTAAAVDPRVDRGIVQAEVITICCATSAGDAENLQNRRRASRHRCHLPCAAVPGSGSAVNLLPDDRRESIAAGVVELALPRRGRYSHSGVAVDYLRR